ncbi:MAG: FAD:protein FMN transferase, partial [Gammaproteobacteria bacterium]
AAQAAIRRLESKYSRYRPDTLTSRLNATAGTGEWVPVDDETHGLCEMAKQAFMLSDGLFDLTAGVLRKAWDFKSGRIATQADIDALLPLVGWEQIEWKRDSQAPSGWSMRLPLRGMELDFGGIVKEYAADTAATTLMTFDLSIALVDLGGDLRVMGAPPRDSKPALPGLSP